MSDKKRRKPKMNEIHLGPGELCSPWENIIS